MSRKQFILSHGATCDNWNWSWSFVNHERKFVIFGAWDIYTEDDAALVFSEDWRFDQNGRAKAGWEQSRRHIRLIEEQGYSLLTFPILHSNEKQDEHGYGPAKIKGVVEQLSPKTLKRDGKEWYASDSGIAHPIPEEIDNPETYFEGASKRIAVNVYERNAQARVKSSPITATNAPPVISISRRNTGASVPSTSTSITWSRLPKSRSPISLTPSRTFSQSARTVTRLFTGVNPHSRLNDLEGF